MSLILSGTDGLSDVDGSAATPAIRGTDANTGIFFPAADTIAFAEGGVEAMRIDSSGNVGIGTSSPSYKLDVTGQGRATTGFAVSTDGSTFTPSGLNAIPNYGVGYITSTSQVALSGFGGIPFYTNQAERMRIDSSGNLLVGTTSTIRGSKQSIYSGATNATTYNTASFQGGSVLTVQNQQTTSVSTSVTVIATTGIYATLALVYGSDGTNRFQDLIMVGLATGTVNVINSFTVGGSPASRTYSQSASAYRLQMGSGTYTVQFSGLSQGD